MPITSTSHGEWGSGKTAALLNRTILIANIVLLTLRFIDWGA